MVRIRAGCNVGFAASVRTNNRGNGPRLAGYPRVTKEAPKQSPVPPSEENLLAGANIYRENCAICHGTAGEPKTPFAKGMYPPPPQFLKDKGVTDDPIGVTFWKVTNGIRLTGMPAFEDSLKDQQRWQVSELLANADKLSPTVKDVLDRPTARKP